jgi:hypothetical protein
MKTKHVSHLWRPVSCRAREPGLELGTLCCRWIPSVCGWQGLQIPICGQHQQCIQKPAATFRNPARPPLSPLRHAPGYCPLSALFTRHSGLPGRIYEPGRRNVLPSRSWRQFQRLRLYDLNRETSVRSQGPPRLFFLGVHPAWRGRKVLMGPRNSSDRRISARSTVWRSPFNPNPALSRIALRQHSWRLCRA